jgi:hypothetical protein
MAPIRSIPILMGLYKGCSQLPGKSRGDRMLEGSGPIGRDERELIRLVGRTVVVIDGRAKISARA